MKKRFAIDIPTIKEIEKNHHNLTSENTPPAITSETIKESLRTCIRIENDNVYINAESIRKTIFPHKNVDVFISHAHLNHSSAAILKLYIEKYLGLDVFLDFQCWGYKDHLQELINDKYSLYPGHDNLYKLSHTNAVATNVDMILNRALLEVISEAPNFIIIKSDYSIPSTNIINNTLITQSPWIHNEIAYVNALFKEAHIKSASLNEEMQVFAAKVKKTFFEHDLDISQYECLHLANIKNKLSI